VVSILLTENTAEAMRKNYSSDLTDSQWNEISKWLDTERHRHHDLCRDLLDGVLYLTKTGCQWRMLPGEFAPWQTVYYYFRKWKEQGVIERILDFVRRKVRTEEAGREPTPSAVMIDCQSVTMTRVGGCSGFDGHKKVEGRKRHVVVDTEGLNWEASVHAANENESQRAFEMIASVFQKSDRLEAVFADRAYQGDLEDDLAEELGLEMEITSTDSEEPGFSVEPKRWIVERTFGWFGGWRRLSKEYEHLFSTSKAMVQLASLKVALNRL